MDRLLIILRNNGPRALSASYTGAIFIYLFIYFIFFYYYYYHYYYYCAKLSMAGYVYTLLNNLASNMQFGF